MNGPAPPYRVVLLDIDGTLTLSSRPIPGAIEAISTLRRSGVTVRLVTNTTRKPRREIHRALSRVGFEVELEDILTAPCAAARWLQDRGLEVVYPLLRPATREDLLPLTLVTGEPVEGLGPVQAVLVGDLGSEWTYEAMNRAFRHIHAGALLVACQRNRYWQEADGLSLDGGPFVAALEYACRTEAIVVGKPSPEFFLAALAGLPIDPGEALMVGDDVEGDVLGALDAGLGAALVRTGKFREDDLARLKGLEGRSARLLGSVADLPRSLGLA